jgi:hypothetical protein
MKDLSYWDNIEKWRLLATIRLIEGKEFNNPEDDYEVKKRPKKYI